MGVPVVTCVGRTVVGRAGYSQLSNLGLPDLVAWSDDQFVSIASSLAGDFHSPGPTPRHAARPHGTLAADGRGSLRAT